MEIFAIIIVVSVLSVVGRVLLRVFAARAAMGAAQHFSGGGLPNGGMQLDPQFMQAMQQMQALIAQAQQAQGGLGGFSTAGLPPHLQVQFQGKMLEAQRQMRDMDNLSRQKADLAKADMLGQASAAGIDVSRWRF
jgi:hypothetical protein